MIGICAADARAVAFGFAAAGGLAAGTGFRTGFAADFVTGSAFAFEAGFAATFFAGAAILAAAFLTTFLTILAAVFAFAAAGFAGLRETGLAVAVFLRGEGLVVGLAFFGVTFFFAVPAALRTFAAIFFAALFPLGAAFLPCALAMNALSPDHRAEK